MQTVVETPSYLAAAKSTGMSEDLRRKIVDLVAADPTTGELLEGTGGFRKFRVARPGQGKSGGFRVISFHHSELIPVFLITVFAKNQQANLTKGERNDLAKLSAILVANYRRAGDRK